MLRCLTGVKYQDSANGEYEYACLHWASVLLRLPSQPFSYSGALLLANRPMRVTRGAIASNFIPRFQKTKQVTSAVAIHDAQLLALWAPGRKWAGVVHGGSTTLRGRASRKLQRTREAVLCASGITRGDVSPR
jgi:hypothetical protein